MKKSTEQKIEKKVGKQLSKQIEKEVKEEVEEEIGKEIKQVKKSTEKEIEKRVEKGIEDIKKEVEKRLHIQLYRTTKSSAFAFKEELKKHTATAITAAFAFLIALSWRNPIQKFVENLIEIFNLKGGEIYMEFMAAIMITLIAVLAIMLISRWTSKSD